MYILSFSIFLKTYIKIIIKNVDAQVRKRVLASNNNVNKSFLKL